MTRSITSPNHLRDTQLLRTIAEMREADRVAQSEDEEPDDNSHVCRTCARFTALGGCDRYVLRCLHLRYDDLEAVMEGLRKGRLAVAAGEQQFVLRPKELLTFTVKARQRGGSGRLSLAISWRCPEQDEHKPGETLKIEA